MEEPSDIADTESPRGFRCLVLKGDSVSLRSIRKRTDWGQMEKEVAALIARLRRKPQKLGYQCSPGGILNAYREGDITFNKAVKELERWKNRKVQNALSVREEPLIHAESQHDMRLRMGF